MSEVASNNQYISSRDETRARSALNQRHGVALLVCLFIISMTSMLLVGVLDTQIGQWSALRNTIDYERATYLAGAGVYHCLAELEYDPSWRTGVPKTEFPPGSGGIYTAEVSEAENGTVIVTATGAAGEVVRRLQVTVEAQ